MIFPYWDISETNEHDLLPVIPLTVHGLKESFGIRAIIDLGAEHNALKIEYADRLGLDLGRAQPYDIIGFGKQAAVGYRDIVEWQLGNYRWAAPVVFVDSPNQFNILGQAGFFAFFNVDFRYQGREIHVRRVRKI